MDTVAELGRNPVSTRFSLSMEMIRLTREGTGEHISRDHNLRRERGQGNIMFPCSADHVQDWQPYPVDPCVCVFHVCVCFMCVCVFFPFILDIKFVRRTSRGHAGGRSHRISHPPSLCGACLNFSREKDSAIPFPRRP